MKNWILLYAASLLGIGSPSLLLAQKKDKIKIDRSLRDTSARYVFHLDNLPRRHVVGFNILALFARNAHVFYEWRARSFLGLRQQVIAGRFSQPSPRTEVPYKVQSTLLGYGLELVFYPLNRAPRGPYLAFGGSYRWFNARIPVITDDPSPESSLPLVRKKISMFSTSVVAGWQFIAGNWFVVNPFSGAALNFPFTYFQEIPVPDYQDQVRVPGTAPVTVRFGLLLGLAIK